MMHFQSLGGAWQARRAGTEEWLAAMVPGCAHTDLLALGRIPDPFVGDNERRVRWVVEADWEYRRLFNVTPDLLNRSRLYPVCDGLDTLVTVSLNGRELGRTANMFRCFRWDVKSLLKPEGNELRIHFESVVKHAAGKQAARSLPGVAHAIAGGPHIRKAPCQFGWDWGPQLPPVGIWKDICLEDRIRSAAQANHNMLRVWGGGFYEDEHFYDLCDRYGILVWQDFIFSCSVYPLDEPDFIENVRAEVIENIRRLRHRASLALW